MIDVAFAVVFANSQKNTESMTDSADRFAGNANFGAGHSLDNGFHDELGGDGVFFQLVHQLDLAKICSGKKDDLALHEIHIPGNKENHC